MTVTKILCPTDFSPGATAALHQAVRLASETGAELEIAHVWYIPPSAYTIEAPFPPYVTQQVTNDAQRALDAALAEAIALGARRVTCKLLSGVPWTVIAGRLEQQAFDLCVLGTHGRTGLARVLLGSVAERVVRHAPCSVMVVRPDSVAKGFAHVLVPTDFSDHVAPALELAPQLVSADGSITLFHVIEIPTTYTGEVRSANVARDLDARASAALEETTQRVRARTAVPVRGRMRVGHAGAQCLAELESDRTVDLVVMGSHGRTGIKRVLLGSVAEKLVRHAHCPVLVARTRV